MEDLEIYNYELVKRICSKLSMFLKDTKSNVSKVSMIVKYFPAIRYWYAGGGYRSRVRSQIIAIRAHGS